MGPFRSSVGGFLEDATWAPLITLVGGRTTDPLRCPCLFGGLSEGGADHKYVERHCSPLSRVAASGGLKEGGMDHA